MSNERINRREKSIARLMREKRARIGMRLDVVRRKKTASKRGRFGNIS